VKNNFLFRSILLSFLAVFLILPNISCQRLQDIMEGNQVVATPAAAEATPAAAEATPAAAEATSAEAEATSAEAEATATNAEGIPIVREGEIRQWAVEAEASSAYANPEWAASQATGAPDTQRCGDYQTAWATAGSDSTGWLEVRFPIAVHVTSVNIVQSFNPNQVVKVELVSAFDRTIEIYNQPPIQVDQTCPYTLSIPVEKTEGQFDTIRITLDQSVLGLGWNQVDAVELVGVPD
jgi:hypothetical protein